MIGQKRCNSNDTNSTFEQATGELRATLLGNHSGISNGRTHRLERARRSGGPGCGADTRHQDSPRPNFARNLTRSFFKIGQKRCNSNDTNSTFEQATGELRATLLGNHSDQRGGRTHRQAAPVTSRCTRYVALHPLRGATPDQKGCTAYGSGAAPPVTRTNAEAARRGPGCGAGGWRQGLAGLRGDAPSEARSADGSRAGRHPRAHRAARPTQTNNTAPRNQARRQASPPAPHNVARPRPFSRPRPRRAQSAPLSAAQPSGTAEQAPPIRRSCPRDPRPRRGRPRGGRRGHGTGSRTRSPGPRRGRSGSTAGRHRARHTRRA